MNKTAIRIKYLGQTVSCSRYRTRRMNRNACLDALTILTGNTVSLAQIRQSGGSVEAYASRGGIKFEFDERSLSVEEPVKLSDLSETQLSHLVWRLDHKTACGLLTAQRVAKGEMGDLEVVEVFRQAGKSEHSAKIHARKVIDFSV